MAVAASLHRRVALSPTQELIGVSTPSPRFDLVIAANRLPVDRVVGPDGESAWRRSPGGLVTAMESVMRGREGAWVGWAGEPGDAPEPFEQDNMYLAPVPLSEGEVSRYYEGFSNDTLWPIYHDVIVPATFHRAWWNTYRDVNRRFAEAVAKVVSPGGTVWVHDYQLQLVPAMVRELRPDVRIGWFNHIPFPPVELFAQLPWRRAVVEGLLGADFLGFQRTADAENFLRACRRLLGMTTKGDTVVFTPHGSGAEERTVRASAIPISVDFRGLDQLARDPEVIARSREIRESLGNPRVLMLGVDRLDYTKGIRHRLKAYEELLHDKEIAPPDTVLVQVATPSRERVEAYRQLRQEVETTVGRMNGEYSDIGSPAVQYLHHGYGREEMAALFLAADVMLVTPLRDGMNLVAKEYVACRTDLGGALVLSEFAGAWHELHQSFVCNPHDIAGLKQTIMYAINTPAPERRRRMKALRRRVADHDVQRWAERYLEALAIAPRKPQRQQRQQEQAEQAGARQDLANRAVADLASEFVQP
jgi:trehalose 6-phosphate synthase